MTDRGFTLLETLIAVAVLSMVVVGTMGSFMVQAAANSRSEQRTEAVAAAEQAMEALRLDDPELMPSSGVVGPQLISLNNRSYQVYTKFCTRPQYCNQTARHLRIEVHLDGRRIYDVETIFSQLR